MVKVVERTLVSALDIVRINKILVEIITTVVSAVCSIQGIKEVIEVAT
jgi:hypothetical protein